MWVTIPEEDFTDVTPVIDYACLIQSKKLKQWKKWYLVMLRLWQCFKQTFFLSVLFGHLDSNQKAQTMGEWWLVLYFHFLSSEKSDKIWRKAQTMGEWWRGNKIESTFPSLNSSFSQKIDTVNSTLSTLLYDSISSDKSSCQRPDYLSPWKCTHLHNTIHS